MLGHQVLVQVGDVDRARFVLPVCVPRRDHLGHRLRSLRLVPAPVLGAGGRAAQVVAHRPFRHAQLPGDLAVALALLGQDSYRHDLLLAQATRHRPHLQAGYRSRTTEGDLCRYACGLEGS